MDLYVARQPIFNREKELYGYELLFREGISNYFPDIDGDIATSKVLSGSFFLHGIERLIGLGSRYAFINFTENLLKRKVALLFPKRFLVVEILEDIIPDEDLIEACRFIYHQGYTLALDDFIFKKELSPLIEIAEIIKFDLLQSSLDEIRPYLEQLSKYKLRFLAEKVEDYGQFREALEMGFSYFQGYFFSRPELIKGKEIPSLKLNLLQLMAEVNKEDFEIVKVEKIIKRDISLSYKLLRLINSVYFRRVQEVTSIKQAMVLIGEDKIRQFISFIALSGIGVEKPTELISNSIIRAKFCELLGERIALRYERSEYFTLGLFSLIDAIMDEEMEHILQDLPLSVDIKDALIRREGELYDILALVIAYERADWKGVKDLAVKLSLSDIQLPSLYMESIKWADSFIHYL